MRVPVPPVTSRATMKRWMLVMVAGAALLVGCGSTGVSNNVQPGSEFTADDLTIITVDWRGMKCDLAYIYLTNNDGTRIGTGGPALATLGCYDEAAR